MQESSLLLSNPTPETTVSSPYTETLGSAIDDDLSERKTFPFGFGPYITLSSRVKGLDQGFNSAVPPALRRARSQVDIGKNAQQHVAEEPLVASRRSSISYLCLSDETKPIPELTDPLRSGLDHGLVKWHKRTSSIELAQWQRTHDWKVPQISSSQVERPQPVERHNVSPRSQAPDSDHASSGNEDCEGEKTDPAKTKSVQETAAEVVCHETATNDPRCVLQAQSSAITFAEYKAKVEEQHNETIAFKDEQMNKVVSMYQALVSQHEDLKTETEQRAMIQSKAAALTQASSAELTQLRVAFEAQKKEAWDALQYLNYLQVELDSMNDSHRAQDVLLFNAYGKIDELTKQLATANTNGGQSKIKDLEKKLVAAKDKQDEQEGQLFNAFQAHQALEGDKQQLKEEVKKLTNLNMQVTNELVDMKSECERNLVQNMMMRETMEADPKKAAEYDKTVEHLKGELAEADERAVQAEETSIQLQKDMDENAVRSKTETTALKEENRILTLAIDDLRSSKDTVQKALTALIKSSQSNPSGPNLTTALQTHHTDLTHQQQQHDTHLHNLISLHTHALSRTKLLETRCNSLESTATEQAAQYIDLENAHRTTSAQLSILQLESTAQTQAHATALAEKSSALTAAEAESAGLKRTLRALQSATTDTCTAWFLARQERDLAEAKTALEEAEKRAEALGRDLATRIEYEGMDKFLRDSAAYDEANFPELEQGRRDEVEVLRGRIEAFEKGWCSPDVLLWKDHLRRVEEVREQTMVKGRAEMEEGVRREVVGRVEGEWVVPLRELGGLFWGRIWRLERVLMGKGWKMGALDDGERRSLVAASRRFGVL